MKTPIRLIFEIDNGSGNEIDKGANKSDLWEDKLNKIELIAALRQKSDISKSEAAAVVDLIFDQMVLTLTRGDRVEVRGLCSFYVKEYKSYTGRNPKTGEKVKIEPKKLPFFKAGKELKERVNR